MAKRKSSSRKTKKQTREKVWGGRFAKKMDSQLVEFNASIDFDKRLAEDDIAGSIAHCRMLADCGLLRPVEAKKLVQGLQQIETEIAKGKFQFSKADEDIHMNIERRLVELTGDLGKKLHTARSRNDQVALDTRLFTRRAIDEWLAHLKDFEDTLIQQASTHINVIMPGYTHLQRAQPVSLAHHLLAYFEMFHRDRERLGQIRERVNQMPLGSGALAGTTLGIDRKQVAKSLQFDGLTQNSMDAVADRDYLIEFTNAGALIMMHLSRMAEEWILWSSSEFGFIEIDESLCTGSSMMPQKKNPDVPELVRGKTARVYGNLMTLLTLTKGLPLTYNKDLQEDKEPLFDTFDTVKNSLAIMARVLKHTKFLKKRLLEAADEPLILATDLAEYLVEKGVPFREAHETVGQTVRYCLEKEKGLKDLSLAEFRRISPVFDKGVLKVLDLQQAVDRRNSTGGTSRKLVEKALRQARSRLQR